MPPAGFIQLPLAFDLTATFVSALAGALSGVQRRYDFVGVFVLAFVSGVGGAVLRDGLFLNAGPVAVVRDSRYVLAVLLATLAGVGIDRVGRRVQRVITVFDAVGLGVYAVVGADRSLAAGLGHLGAVLVGVANAVGGGLLRDVLTAREPDLFMPGQFLATAAILSAGLYVGLREADITPTTAAGWAITAGLTLRLLAVRYNWRTRPLFLGYWGPDGRPQAGS